MRISSRQLLELVDSLAGELGRLGVGLATDWCCGFRIVFLERGAQPFPTTVQGTFGKSLESAGRSASGTES